MTAMQALRRAQAKQPARRSVLLPISAFAETWARRPHSPARVGLRSVSELDIERAQSEAANAAWTSHPRPEDEALRVEVFNDHLVTEVLARACVQHDDVSAPFFAPIPSALIREALTAGGIRRLWDEYCRMAIEDSPLSPEASDADVRALAAVDMASLPEGVALRVRRLVAAALAELPTDGEAP